MLSAKTFGVEMLTHSLKDLNPIAKYCWIELFDYGYVISSLGCFQ